MVGCPTLGGAGGVEFWEDGRRREGPAVVGRSGGGRDRREKVCGQLGTRTRVRQDAALCRHS